MIFLDIIHNDQKGIPVIDHIDDTWQVFVIQFFQDVGLSDQSLFDCGKILLSIFSPL